jgi:hypothetical protein
LANRLSRSYFQQQGAKGGKRAASRLTAAERIARATKASQAAAVARKKKRLT